MYQIQCLGCKKTLNIDLYNYHKKYCIHYNLLKNININISKEKLSEIITISNLLLFNSTLQYPLTKSFILSNIIKRKNIDKNNHYINKLYNHVLAVNNIYKCNKNDILHLISNITSTETYIITEINNIYNNCVKNI